MFSIGSISCAILNEKTGSSKKNGKNRFEYKYKYLKIVWDLLYRFIDRNKKYEFVRDNIWALQKFHSKMTHREKPIYLYHAVLLIVRRHGIDWNSQPPSIDTPMADVDKLYWDSHRVNQKNNGGLM